MIYLELTYNCSERGRRFIYFIKWQRKFYLKVKNPLLARCVALTFARKRKVSNPILRGTRNSAGSIKSAIDRPEVKNTSYIYTCRVPFSIHTTWSRIRSYAWSIYQPLPRQSDYSPF